MNSADNKISVLSFPRHSVPVVSHSWTTAMTLLSPTLMERAQSPSFSIKSHRAIHVLSCLIRTSAIHIKMGTMYLLEKLKA